VYLQLLWEQVVQAGLLQDLEVQTEVILYLVRSPQLAAVAAGLRAPLRQVLEAQEAQVVVTDEMDTVREELVIHPQLHHLKAIPVVQQLLLSGLVALVAAALVALVLQAQVDHLVLKKEEMEALGHRLLFLVLLLFMQEAAVVVPKVMVLLQRVLEALVEAVMEVSTQDLRLETQLPLRKTQAVAAVVAQ